MDNDLKITRAMYKHLNAWPDKPCPINLEVMDKAPIALSMALQQLSGTRIVRKYIDGTFVGSWPFAVYVRMSGTDTAKRFDADGALIALSDWLEENLPDLGDTRTANKIEMTSLPSVAATYEDGGTDYQAIFSLEYQQKRSDI